VPDAPRRLDKYVPVCGEDFCESCGDCLTCYSGDPCYDGGTTYDGHSWPARYEGEREEITEP
jgi:hypothetical protein